MKNLMKSALIALTMGVFAIPASAESVIPVTLSVQDTIVKKDTIVKEEAPLLLAQEEVAYTKIELTEVPEKVATAVAAKYEGFAIEEAAKGSDNSFKLVIKKEDAQLTVYFNESGEFLKEGTAKAEGTVLV